MRYLIKSVSDNVTAYGAVKNITARDVAGAEVSGAVFLKQKDGTDFPNFEAIIPNAEIELNSWVSPTTGKTSFFPPKPLKTHIGATGGARSALIGKAMEKKEASIEKFQGNKELGIKISSTLRMAVDIVIAQTGDGTEPRVLNNEIIQESILFWRAWLWSEWDKEDKDFPPF